MPERKKSPSGLKNRPGSGEEKDIQEVLHDRRQNGVVKRMCAEDQLYLDLEQEFQRKSAELQVEYTKKQQKHLDARKEILKADGKDVPSFWLEAMKNVPHLADDIAEHDEPLLACVTDIRVDNLPDPAAMQQTGFFVEFEFSEKIDEWLDFSKTEEFKKDGKRVLKRTFHTKVESPYVGELSVEKIELNSCGGDGSLEGMWKAGKNITVEKKKVKAGKKKKGKATHVEKEVPRESFFRRFFRTIDPENQQVEDLQDLLEFAMEELGTDMMDEETDPTEILEHIREAAHEAGLVLKDSVIPFAVRWYTGEAVPEGYFDEDEDDEDGDLEEEDMDEMDGEDDEDDSDDDDDSDDGDSNDKKKKVLEKKDLFAKKGEDGKEGDAKDVKAEECKNQ